ncbi:MAG: hypothetical protein JNJ73_01335 [Hyphomonadaceae bacterium]|nr:hypothetical protein [Hyphomonadaceae bacterium]
MTYRTLAPDKIVETLERLHARIKERFPDAGLEKVSADVTELARTTAARAAQLARPFLWLRLLLIALVIAGLAAQIYAARFLHVSSAAVDAPEFMQGLESAVNLLILFGGAVWFLLTLEERIKRGRALAALHELRSLAHVIDMHQLTKDPTLVVGGNRTAASPVREMSQFELTRYLDYCAEMLALIGKLAALYGERLRDPVIVEAVNDIENLTANLGRKIWQKITIIGQLVERKG